MKLRLVRSWRPQPLPILDRCLHLVLGIFERGLDHERLTFEHNGIERCLTNVEGRVIQQILV